MTGYPLSWGQLVQNPSGIWYIKTNEREGKSHIRPLDDRHRSRRFFRPRFAGRASMQYLRLPIECGGFRRRRRPGRPNGFRPCYPACRFSDDTGRSGPAGPGSFYAERLSGIHSAFRRRAKKVKPLAKLARDQSDNRLRRGSRGICRIFFRAFAPIVPQRGIFARL